MSLSDFVRKALGLPRYHKSIVFPDHNGWHWHTYDDLKYEHCDGRNDRPTEINCTDGYPMYYTDNKETFTLGAELQLRPWGNWVGDWFAYEIADREKQDQLPKYLCLPFGSQIRFGEKEYTLFRAQYESTICLLDNQGLRHCAHARHVRGVGVVTHIPGVEAPKPIRTLDLVIASVKPGDRCLIGHDELYPIEKEDGVLYCPDHPSSIVHRKCAEDNSIEQCVLLGCNKKYHA